MEIALSIALCDSNGFKSNTLSEQLDLYNWGEAVRTTTDFFASDHTLIDTIRQGKKYDMIFLDAGPSEHINVAETGTEIRKCMPDALLYCISSQGMSPSELFKTEAFCIMQKPVSQNELNHVLDHGIARLKRLAGYC